MNTEILIFIAAGIYGACIGSFMNVCIARIPEKMSIVSPRSYCPSCGSQIKWYDNIPVISYLILSGKCRQCNKKISIQYPAVEIMTAFFSVYSISSFSFTLKALAVFIFVSVLIVISFIDLEHKIIPDIISLPGIPLFFAAGFFIMGWNLKNLVLGVLVGGGSLYLVALIYYLITKKEGMGGGDIKLLAMIGAFIGYKGVFFTVFASSLTGTLAGIAFMLLKEKNFKYAIPFGPFLSLGAVIYIFLGKYLINVYMNLIIN
ncbi:MAG: prepilin peptidase [Deltaproteobacteria bacterium]|nr:MAG: prepilin peptidase [Deltaproteobacteria bacterium]